MRLFPASLLLLPLLSAAAQTTPSTKPDPGAGASSASMATYRNDDLHLSYSYPSSYADASAVVGPAFQASLSGDPTSASAARCITLPFSRMETGTGQVGILLLIRADAGCLKKKFTAKSLAEFTQGEAQGLAAAGAKTTFGQPQSFEIASHPAALLQGTFTLPAGQPMQALVVCVLDQPDIVCWQFLATSADHIRTMSAFPVTFDNSPATPLVPITAVKP